MSSEIKIVECNTVLEAEAEYSRLRQEGCWQMVSVLKIKWSWKKMRYVATFSMKKVKLAYHFDDYVKDTIAAIKSGTSVLNDYYKLKASKK